jgi:alkylation response protein AidB-like acyl-CoA dehydrogenase
MQAHEVSDLLRQSAKEFLSRREGRASHGLQQGDGFDLGLWREMADLGWLGLGLPEDGGGSETGLREAAVLCEEFGRVAWAVPYVACSVLPSALLAGCTGGASCVAELARTCVAGERPFAVAWQEESRQMDDVLATTQFIDGRVAGVKRFVGAADPQSILLVSAQFDGTPVLIAVEANAPGVIVERYAAGLSSEATVRFESAPVLFNGPLATGVVAQAALANALRAARIALCAQLAGLAGGLLEKTLDYIGNRVQFGRPISSFQTIRHRCVDLYIATRLASASWKHALRCFETAPDATATAVAIHAAKARCGNVSVQVAREAVQMHGAMGFTEEGGVGLYFRAALHGRAWLGAPLMHRRLFMEELVKLHRRAVEVHDA